VPDRGHSAKSSLSSVPVATLGKDSLITLCRVSTSRHSAKPALPSVICGHSANYIFIFLKKNSKPKFLWCVPTLYRPTCTICRCTIPVAQGTCGTLQQGSGRGGARCGHGKNRGGGVGILLIYVGSLEAGGGGIHGAPLFVGMCRLGLCG
jgi:hypothetical protein